MEVIRSTNIVFNPNTTRRGSNENVAKKQKKSPVESKSQGNPKHDTVVNSSPIKGQHVEDSARGNNSVNGMNGNVTDDSPLFRRVRDVPGPVVVDTSLSWRRRESPADSGVDLSPLSLSPSKPNPKNLRLAEFGRSSSIKLRTMYSNSRREADEGTEFSINPDPVPYQPNNFIPGRNSRLDAHESSTMSSTLMKKVPVARRHFDTFGSYDWMAGIAKRGVMLHTDRYQWDIAKALDGLSQRERLHAELEYMERLRGIKRRREVLPHRAQLDLLMGGKKVEFNERFQIQREIEKLKSLILPQHAKDLFHGRGFVLPANHNSVKPRHPLDPRADLEEELSSPFSPDKYSFNPETGRVHPRNRQDQSGTLPKINNKGYLLGQGAPIILSKEKRTVESIKARLQIPTNHFRAQKGEPIPVKTPNPFTVEMEDTWTPFVTRQSTMMSPIQRTGSKSPVVPYSPRRNMKPTESPDLTLYPVSQGPFFSPRYGTGLGGAPQPAHLTRSKTNVTTGGQQVKTEAGITGRSVTAFAAKKDTGGLRPTVTAPTSKPAHVSSFNKAEIKIPVSARDPEEPEAQPESTPTVPKSTPAASKNPDAIEEESDLVIEDWPEVDEAAIHNASENEGRDDPSRLSSRQVMSPGKAPTPNPLKAVELVRNLSQDEQARLKQTFNKLDTDKDGHIMFSQLQTQLPKQFTQSQEKYIKQVYDITSSNTFFGVDEFMTMSYLTGVVTNLTGEPLDAYNKLDFHGLHDVILRFVELFQLSDRNHRGKISLSALQEILSTAMSIDFKTEPPKWNKLIDTIEISEPGVITKIEFLAHIPYFQTITKRK